MDKFFHDSLKDIYWAEKNLAKALPKLQKEATSQELKTAIADHTRETQSQADRLEEVFAIIGKNLRHRNVKRWKA
nr:DUF892 family protein [Chitinophaga sedimenti]